MDAAWKDPLTRYGAQNVAQLDAKLRRWAHQTSMDTNSLKLLTTYHHLAYQLFYHHQFHQ